MPSDWMYRAGRSLRTSSESSAALYTSQCILRYQHFNTVHCSAVFSRAGTKCFISHHTLFGREGDGGHSVLAVYRWAYGSSPNVGRHRLCIHHVNQVNSRNDYQNSRWQHHKDCPQYYYYYYYYYLLLLPANAVKRAGCKVHNTTGRSCENTHQTLTNTCSITAQHNTPTRPLPTAAALKHSTTHPPDPYQHLQHYSTAQHTH